MAATLAIGRPTVFTDTDDYYAQGGGVVRSVFRYFETGTPVLNFEDIDYRKTHADGAEDEPVHNQDGARSVYYGVFLYLLHWIGTLWAVAAAQSAMGAALIYALWRKAAPDAAFWTFTAIMGGLAFGSTMPVFTGFAMPDIFAGYGAIAAILLFVYGDRFSAKGQIALWLAIAWAMNVHGSNLFIEAALAGLGVVWLWWVKRPVKVLATGAGAVLCAAAVAMLAASAYATVVKLKSGDTLGRPPFLSARVLADGPGRAYLRKVCKATTAANAPYVLCQFRHLPLDDEEDLLWSDDKNLGAFNVSEFHMRELLLKEETRFVLASVLSNPLWQLNVSLQNWATQIVDTRLDEPLKNPAYYIRDPYWNTTYLPDLTTSTAPCPLKDRVCAPRINGQPTAIYCAGLALGWGLLLLWRFTRRDIRAALASRREDDLARLAVATGLVFLAVFINAGVCGILSGPFPRYQSRIFWLIPLAAMMLEAGLASLRTRKA